MIMLQVSQDDREALKNIVNSMGIEMPDIKIDAVAIKIFFFGVNLIEGYVVLILYS